MSAFVMTHHAIAHSMRERNIDPSQVDQALARLEDKAKYVTQKCVATQNGLTFILAPSKQPGKVAVITLWVTGRHIG